MSKKKEINLAEMTPEQVLEYAAKLQKKNEELENINEKLEKTNAELEDNLTKVSVVPIEPVAEGMTPEQWLEELVPFQAFKDNDRYKEDIVVKNNGERLQIPRGKHHMIKRKFYFALSDAERQGNMAADVQSDYENQFENDVKPRM